MLEQRWEDAFKLLYGRDSLRAYRSRSCVKCRQEYDALLHQGRCPRCGHRSILASFLEKATAEVEHLLEGEARGVC
jgi:rRNA maturation endonuclease Nob1